MIRIERQIKRTKKWQNEPEKKREKMQEQIPDRMAKYNARMEQNRFQIACRKRMSNRMPLPEKCGKECQNRCQIIRRREKRLEQMPE